MSKKAIRVLASLAICISQSAVYGKSYTPKSIIVVGIQFGNESKGKIIDLLADNPKASRDAKPKAVCRFNSNLNSTHLLHLKGTELKLNILPPEIAKQDVLCILGSNTAFHPDRLTAEIQELEKAGLTISLDNLNIAATASLILPLYKDLQAIEAGSNTSSLSALEETDLSAADKIAHRALVAGDLVGLNHEQNLTALIKKVDRLLSYHNALRRVYGKAEIKSSELISYLKDCAHKIAPYVTDAALPLNKLQEEGQAILVEGAQSVWLDHHNRTSPFMPNTTALATVADSSLGIKLKDSLVVGVIQAYTAHEANTPFPTVMGDETATKIQQFQDKEGAPSKNQHKYAWLDLVAIKQMIRMNGIGALALTNGDDLDGFETIKVCTGYEIDGQPIKMIPFDPARWSQMTPIYREFKGWKKSRGVKIYQDLDHNYRIFVKFLEQELKLPIVMISTGSKREETVIRQDPFAIKIN